MSFAFALLMLTSGCAPYRISTLSFLDEPPIKEQERIENAEYAIENEEKEQILYENKKQALQHPLYQIIPRHRSQIQWYDIGHWTTWMLFGNDDDGIFGEEASAHFQIYRPNRCSKALTWGIRNPLHNFSFYVIGSAQCRNSGFTIIKMAPGRICLLTYQPETSTVFADKNTSFYMALHGWKPFVSLRLRHSRCTKSDFYLGWRCRGNFGIKCIPFTREKKAL